MDTIHVNLHSWNPNLINKQTKDILSSQVFTPPWYYFLGFFHIYVSDYIYTYIHLYHLSINICEIVLILTLDRQKVIIEGIIFLLFDKQWWIEYCYNRYS